jgi:cytochrome c biogenesis protein CcdA
MRISVPLPFSLAAVIVPLSSNLVSDKLRDISKYSMPIRKFAGVVLLLVGVYYLSFLGYLPSVPLPTIF